jgi:hypothetical protein
MRAQAGAALHLVSAILINGYKNLDLMELDGT